MNIKVFLVKSSLSDVNKTSLCIGEPRCTGRNGEVPSLHDLRPGHRAGKPWIRRSNRRRNTWAQVSDLVFPISRLSESFWYLLGYAPFASISSDADFQNPGASRLSYPWGWGRQLPRLGSFQIRMFNRFYFLISHKTESDWRGRLCAVSLYSPGDTLGSALPCHPPPPLNREVVSIQEKETCFFLPL